MSARYRWCILGVFVLSTSINYLDRQTLSALAPAVQDDLHLNDTTFGLLLAAFAAPYAITAPFAGLLIDAIGLTRAISLALAVWSCAGIATGLTRGLGSLIACRVVLGIAEAAGIPAAGKAIATLVKPGERAFGHALNQAALSLGMMVAPAIATWIALHWGGWRSAFIVTGILGLLWIPLWRAVSPPSQMAATQEGRVTPYRDGRLWAVCAANALHALPYSLWFGWTTKYLYTVFSLSLAGANAYAWIPPGFGAAGGFLCGWASLRLARRGDVVAARRKVCLAAALAGLVTAVVPFAPSPAWAAAAISLGIAAIAGFSVNLYALPLDLFGESRAAFSISLLVATYGATTAIISPAIGWTRDHYGYMPVTTVAAVTPLIGAWVLRTVRPDA